MNIITIDGPVGSGKGTVGQMLALKLGWKFLDSGALYRLCALVAFENSYDCDQAEKILEIVNKGNFESIPRPDGGEAKVLMDGEDVSERIRTPAISQMASQLAAEKQIRDGLMSVQRNYPRQPGLVADGRDMGTVVFPDAVMKVYLDADIESRAKRKHIQLKNKGIYVNFDTLCREIGQRDARDSSRIDAPLAKPTGAFVIDTSKLLPDEVVRRILGELDALCKEDFTIETCN